MSFEEYIKSDEGKERLNLAKNRNTKLFRVAIITIVCVALVSLLSLPLEFIPDEVLESNRAVQIYRIVALCLSAAVLIVMGLLLWLTQKNVHFNSKLLAKALSLFWQENPIPWEEFIQGAELIVTVENIYPEGYGAPKNGSLQELLLLGGTGKCTLDMRLWNGAVDGAVENFLAYSLIPFLKYKESRGEMLSTVRLTQTIHGKSITDKKSGYIVKAGKFTRDGRSLLKCVNQISERL